MYHDFKDNKDNPHYFLSEELLVPRGVNNSDTQRINMFANHINQFIHLVKPEFPKVFTNFENQVGKYSVAYKEAKEDFVIIAKIYKNKYNYDLIVQYKQSKVYDILHYRRAVNITEDYGYALEDCIPDKDVGDTLSKGEYVYRSTNYDDDKNYSYGINLKSVFLPFKNLTYEDGVVISESAAKKLAAYKVEQTIFSINSNDILINLYGDEYYYKSFPRIGDIIDNRILVAIRRIQHDRILYDFKSEKLMEIDNLDDTVIYTDGGEVVDIDVFSNIPLGKLKERENEFSKEIVEIYEEQYNYYKKLADELEKIIPCRVLTEDEEKEEIKKYGMVIKHPILRADNSNKYTDELAYWWKNAHEQINEKIYWRHEGKTFDSFKLQFTILKENPVTPGVKITNRYGGKGTLAMILPDEEMPTTEDGVVAEAVLNPLGVLNRLNLAQIIEQYINLMTDNLIKSLKEKQDNLFEMEDEFFGFMKIINKEQYDFLDMEYIMMNRSQKEQFFQDIIDNGIYIHQSPYMGNTTMDEFTEIYEKYPHLVEKSRFINIEKPMIMADMYFIRLKHETANKTSIRATGLNNIKNLPSKSTLKKQKKILVSQTPIRLGRQNSILPSINSKYAGNSDRVMTKTISRLKILNILLKQYIIETKTKGCLK
jgi:DNA-directed RNA polymerase beta subunit